MDEVRIGFLNPGEREPQVFGRRTSQIEYMKFCLGTLSGDVVMSHLGSPREGSKSRPLF